MGTTTNTRGYYDLPGPHRETCGHRLLHRLSRTAFSVVITGEETVQRNVHLVPGRIELDEMTVLSGETPRPTDTDIGLMRITAREIAVVPPGVESDIFRVLQAEPGVSTTGDVSARYYVRGGGGTRICSSLTGPPSTIRSTPLGSSAWLIRRLSPRWSSTKADSRRIAGRLSSILNVVTRDGNNTGWAGRPRSVCFRENWSSRDPSLPVRYSWRPERATRHRHWSATSTGRKTPSSSMMLRSS